MEKGTKLVLEQIVTTLASVADTAEEKFEQYYDRFGHVTVQRGDVIGILIRVFC
jgi:hypothetical protein